MHVYLRLYLGLKVAGLRPASLLKKDSDTGFFSVNFAKFLKR